jgi:hypothetical protein
MMLDESTADSTSSFGAGANNANYSSPHKANKKKNKKEKKGFAVGKTYRLEGERVRGHFI